MEIFVVRPHDKHGIKSEGRKHETQIENISFLPSLPACQSSLRIQAPEQWQICVA